MKLVKASFKTKEAVAQAKQECHKMLQMLSLQSLQGKLEAGCITWKQNTVKPHLVHNVL